MSRIYLIHWNAEEAAERAERLKRLGYDADYDPRPIGAEKMRALRENPPDVLVIDLGRLPSNGRDVAMQIRMSPRTRSVPIVFVDGLPEKRERTRQYVPDGIFTTWEEMAGALKRAIENPPPVVRVPRSIMDAYHTTPLATKLGIREGSKVLLIDAPDDFTDLLGDLPEGAVLTTSRSARPDMAIWFVPEQEELEMGIDGVMRRVGDAVLWVAWPKKGKRGSGAISYTTITGTIGSRGYNQSKICALDNVWSAVRCTRPR